MLWFLTLPGMGFPQHMLWKVSWGCCGKYTCGNANFHYAVVFEKAKTTYHFSIFHSIKSYFPQHMLK